MTSVLPLLILGGVWYLLAADGNATRTIWLVLNILDTFRALRLVRPNGRRIGIATRRRFMREALTEWVAYVRLSFTKSRSSFFKVFMARFVSLPDHLFSWVPLYPVLRSVAFGIFFATRIASSAAIYDSIIRPVFSRYGTSIDLTLLLFESSISLVFHYLVQVPASHILAVLLSRLRALDQVKEEGEAQVALLERMPGGRLVVDDTVSVIGSAGGQVSTLDPPVAKSPSSSKEFVLADPAPTPRSSLSTAHLNDDPVFLGQKRKTSTQSTSLRRAPSTISLISNSTASSHQAPPPVPKKTPAPSVRSQSVNIPSLPPKLSLVDKKTELAKAPKPGEGTRPTSTRLRSVPSSLTLHATAPSSVVPVKKTSTYAFSGGRPVTGKVDLTRSNTSTKLGPSASAPAIVKPLRTLSRSKTEQTLGVNGSTRLPAKPRPRLLSRSKVGEKRLQVLQDIDEPDAKRARVDRTPSAPNS